MTNPPIHAIDCDAVTKLFDGKYAVRDATLHIEQGSVHAIVGENGAGKSTLLGMISGRLAPDHGQIHVTGELLTGSDPRSVRKHGIAAVYQELTMVPHFTAVQNMFLGQPLRSGGVLNDRDMRRRFEQLCIELDVTLPADIEARLMSVAQQQLVEIMRGVQARTRILMLDEPTATLAEHEREVLYRVIRGLRRQGVTIVFVSHNLDEVLDLSDRITVMRDGQVVTSAPRSDWDKPSLVRAMVGRDVVIERRTERHVLGDELMSATVNVPGVLHDITLNVRRGEIVGLWGLVGSGRTTLFRSLTGVEPTAVGEIRLRGRTRSLPRSMGEAIKERIVMVPESRRAALVMTMDGSDNYWLGRPANLGGLLSRRRERPVAAADAASFGFNASRIGEPVRTLSGGNQQKVLLAKWAGFEPEIFLVDEPTRGIDIGAKSEVLASMVRLAANGAGIVVTSSELEEVLSICDRLIVMAKGKVVTELATRDQQYTVEQIVRYGFGELDQDDDTH